MANACLLVKVPTSPYCPVSSPRSKLVHGFSKGLISDPRNEFGASGKDNSDPSAGDPSTANCSRHGAKTE